MLSARQRAVWNTQLEIGAKPYLNLPVIYRLAGPIDLPALERAVRRLGERQRLLTTAFSRADPIVRAAEPPPLIIRQITPDQLVAVYRAEAAHVFDFDRGEVPFRPVLLRLAPDEHALILVLHLLVADRRSLSVAAGDLAALYSAELGGPEPATLPAQYADVVAEHERNAVRAWDFWAGRLGDLPRLDLWAASERSTQLNAVHVRSSEWSASLGSGLREHCRRSRMTPFTAAATAALIVLSRRVGHDDVRLATMYLNRVTEQELRLVAPLSQGLMIRVRITPEETYGSLETRVRRGLFEGVAHRAAPFDELVAQQHNRGTGQDDLAPVWLDVIESAPENPAAFGDAKTSLFPDISEPPEFPGSTLNLFLDRSPDAVRITGTVNVRLMSAASLTEMVEQVASELSIVVDEASRARRLS